ncbi:MAG: hypothetical protein KDB80_01935 [Planctomycetes bacterium]|nr:hypothetical protein [Planctomycetota bacterium]
MAPTIREHPRATVIPIRECSRCGTVDDVFHLTMVAHLWLCKPCHRSLSFPGTHEAVPDVEHEPDPDIQRRAEDAATLRRLDNLLRWGAVVGRFLGYGLLFWWSSVYPIVAAVLFGVFVADIVTWMFSAWFDARFHGEAVTAEAVSYTLLFLVLWFSGGLDLPEERTSRLIACASAAGVFTLRGMRFWHKLSV